ncbi:MAG: hypothetical protein GXO98_03280 [Nitrospirae bacterium]|nr:hypothetical protein [Nitrospirota bacterium]
MKIRLFLFIFFTLFLAGCATVPLQQKEEVKPIFYPLPPDVPRIQFLTSFSGSQDIKEKKSRFASFIIGKDEEDLPIVKPYGLAIRGNKIYICDTALNTIIIIDMEKKSFRYFAPDGKGRLEEPINISVDKDGTKYVSDVLRGVVVIFNAANKFSGVLAKEGGMKPTDVAIGKERIYVTDLKSNKVRVWDKAKKKFLFAIPVENTKEAKLYSPVNIALDKEGNLYVSDMGAFRVQKYDREGKFIRSFGSLGDAPGQFARPKGIALDKEDRLYVVDAAAQLVQIFDPEGKLLLFFGESQEEKFILNLPAKIRINYSLLPYFQHFAAPSFELQYLIFVTSQYGSHKVSVFGFGRQRQ